MRLFRAATAAFLPLSLLFGSPEVPRLEKTPAGTRLFVDGKPFLILGGQVRNSTPSSGPALARALDTLAAMGANVAEIPLSWEALEPGPGRFDFSQADRALKEARQRGLRVVFLWFGTWKNGESHYAPEWVKRDRARFPRVKDALGRTTEILSPLGAETRAADARAFAALMAHLAEVDQAERTVLMVQVENEPGFLGTDRDFGPEAERRFQGPVPPELTDWCRSHRDRLDPSLAAALAGHPATGTWEQVFGDLAPEAFTAWHVARYVDQVAAAGKRAYPLPMYVNVWLIEGEERAGRWPSGGATEHALDIWKAAAPAIDILAPDIYYPKFHDAAASYARPDNPLWVPETNRIPYFTGFVYTVLGEYGGLGIAPFAVDECAAEAVPGAPPGLPLNPVGLQWADVFTVLRPLLPVLAECQGQGRLHPLLQGIGNGEAWKAAVPLQGGLTAVVDFTIPFSAETGRARGMIVELAPDDFLVVGNGFRVDFREQRGPLRDAVPLSIEEGTFQGRTWVPSRRLNGDERHVELPARSTVLRVRFAR